MPFINSPYQFETSLDMERFAAIEGETSVLAIPSIRTVVVISQTSIAGETVISAIPSIRDIVVRSRAALSGLTSIKASGISRNDGALIISGETSILAIGNISLSLTSPEPILNEISSEGFQHQRLKARLLVNGSEVKIRSFNYSKPKGSIGSSLSINLAKADLTQIPQDAVYKFEIGKYYSGSWHWTTLLDNAQLDSSSYALAYLQDTLSFSTIEPLADILDLCPRKNIICYSTSKISISLDEIEPIFDQFGNQIQTELRGFNILSLYKLLQITFVEGSGFSAVQTNIPNFEISRCDFSITSSYLEAVSGIIGAFEPSLFAVGNTLWILDKTQAIPDDFEPNSITASQIKNFSSQRASAPLIDGYLLQFTDSNTAGNFSEDELKQFVTETGNFGDPDFTSTEITQTFRHWKNTDNPNVILKTDLVREVQETFVNSELISRVTENHFFDGQGKRTESRKKVESLVPDLAAAGAPSLLTCREEIHEFFYSIDRQNPSRNVLDKSILRVSGLVAVDSENQYFEQDFKQDFLEAHKAGNLATTMTQTTGAIKTVIESYQLLGNGQIQTKQTVIDHLRNTITNSFSDLAHGDISLNSISKIRKLVVWRDGVDLGEERGARIIPFGVGELPFIFALPLAQRRLARALNKPQEITLEVVGFDESLDIGVYFGVEGRGAALLGNFLTESFSINGDESGIFTTISASEI